MQGQSFKLRQEMLAVFGDGDGQRCVEYLPTGAVLTVHPGALTSANFTEVIWDSRTFMIFSQDLYDPTRCNHLLKAGAR